jgi:CHAT domain
VELLEQGRSVLWTQALNVRSDLTRLAGKDPGLAERLSSIREVLDTPMPEAAPLVSGPAGGTAPVVGRARPQQDAADLRRRKAREWDDVLAQVRALEGFEHFLAAVPYAELAAVAVDGPVVIVNASRHGCHALIVDASSEQVRVVDLPRMSLDAAVDQANGMLGALEGAAGPRRPFRDREKDRHAILDVLDWLWDVIAEPVLTARGHSSIPDTGGPWPRVWWCPTGPLTVLPIHAAGHHPRLRTATAGSTDCVLDRVISSYTPILTALTRTRQPPVPAPVRQLTIGMPTTPGLPPLPAVPAEMKVVARHFPPGEVNHQLVESQATRAAVLGAIATHSWVHLACHASQQQADPTRSGFALWGATLTITDLAGQPTQRRDLAFLSACETATGSVRHFDEAIHLAAAMQFLGYRHIIATMWTIADPPSPHVVNTVYTTLTWDGRPDSGRAAEALHQAIRSLRQIDPTNPLVWAPYIHLGI